MVEYSENLSAIERERSAHFDMRMILLERMLLKHYLVDSWNQYKAAREPVLKEAKKWEMRTVNRLMRDTPKENKEYEEKRKTREKDVRKRARNKFDIRKVEYPFSPLESLEPGKLTRTAEPSRYHNHCLVVAYADTIPYNSVEWQTRFNRLEKEVVVENLRKYFIDQNDLLNKLGGIVEASGNDLGNALTLNSKEHEKLFKLVANSDFAQIYQWDKHRNDLVLSHFHSKIGGETLNIAIRVAKRLGYLNEDVETLAVGSLSPDQGRYLILLQNKLREYYGFNPNISGRREAAMCAAEHLRGEDYAFNIFVGSEEFNSLIRITPEIIQKYILVDMPKGSMQKAISKCLVGSLDEFVNHYCIDVDGENGICIYSTIITRTSYAQPSKRKRVAKASNVWTVMNRSMLLPKPDVKSSQARPLQFEFET